jgi:hypothetical protein
MHDIGIGDIDLTTSGLLELGRVEELIIPDIIRLIRNDVPVPVVPIYDRNQVIGKLCSKKQLAWGQMGTRQCKSSQNEK